MNIYQSEIDAGLQDQILNSKISIACELFTKDNFQHTKSTDNLIKVIAKANPDQKDLFYKHSILASVGWNSNDDVFDRIETWNARNTPTDKQINFMHNEMDIIGHSTQSSVYDIHGSLIPDNTSVENLPDKFDVITEFVLYQMWDNTERKELMEKLISEIQTGKWFVSMECRFPAFDYAIVDLDGTHKTVARTKNTAFLTKHLRAFGGTGEYEGRKVGRLIRNFFFSGQGIVDKPANPRSIIFNNAVAFSSQGKLIIKEKNKMNEEELKKEIASLKLELDSARAEKQKEKDKEMDDMKHKVECADKEKSEMKAKCEKLEADLADKEKTVAEKDSAIASLTEELKSVNDKLVEANQKIEADKKDKAFAERVSQFVNTGLNSEEAKAEAKKWDSLSDEQFTNIVSVYQSKAEAEKKAKASTTEEVTETTTADLEKAKAEETPAGNSVVDVEANLTKVSDFLSGVMPYSAKASKAEQANK